MKFGFNAFTDEAREKLDELSIKFRRSPGVVEVYTETVDMEEEEYRERYSQLGLSLPPDINKKYRSQGTRIWKNKYTGNYYYLWKDYVFKAERRIKLDYATNPPTQFDFLLLDVVPKEDQAQWRDILIKQPPNADAASGGVLL